MKVKKKNPFYYLFLLSLLIFSALYIALESGYYENKVSKKATITAEKIEEFEEDVAKGNAVDIKEYLKDDYVDYSSKVSKAGISVSNSIDSFMTDGIGKIIKVLDKLF